MFQSFLRHENQHRDAENVRDAGNVRIVGKNVGNHEDKLRESEEESDNSEDDEVVDEDESYFDGRDENEDDNVKFARSIDSTYSEPGSSSSCEGNCKKSKVEEDQVLQMNDTPSGNNKKTTNIATKAAQEAKAAEDAQETAGKEAAKQAKFQLAEKAIQAAKAGRNHLISAIADKLSCGNCQ
jgi:nucleoid-associated protein YgaU